LQFILLLGEFAFNAFALGVLFLEKGASFLFFETIFSFSLHMTLFPWQLFVFIMYMLPLTLLLFITPLLQLKFESFLFPLIFGNICLLLVIFFEVRLFNMFEVLSVKEFFFTTNLELKGIW